MQVPKDKIPYLNVGCGKKYNSNWVNVDMVADGPDVIACNLIEGIPFPDNSFEVVYHSQVIEHIPKEAAAFFIGECYRVLKPNGVIRVVCPDLQNLMEEYQKWLKINQTAPTPESKANYEWILLELFDQMVRNQTGGMTAAYLSQKELPNEEYALHRSGFIGRRIRQNLLNPHKRTLSEAMRLTGFYTKAWHHGLAKIEQMFSGRKRKIGSFRMGGEVHLWMYDQYNLGQLLQSCGFKDAQKMDYATSSIKDWGTHHMDINGNGEVYDPTSLFMEARK
jgi:predicted SAM-dependent methyltransferase